MPGSVRFVEWVAAGAASAVNARPSGIPGASGSAPLVAVAGSPNGGENLSAGSPHDIAFTVSGGTMPSSGALELSTTGPSGPWSRISDLAGVQAGVGKHAWTVPATATRDAHVRLTLKDTSPTSRTVADASNSAFTIHVPVTIVLDRAVLSQATVTASIAMTIAFSARALDRPGVEVPGASYSWVVSGGIGTLAPADRARIPPRAHQDWSR